MFGYYLSLALLSFRRHPGLNILMILAIGVGIGASMTVLTVFRAMSANPIPLKSHQLFVPQIDSWGPDNKAMSSAKHSDNLQDSLTYMDAMALLRASAGKRQLATFKTGLTAVPADERLLPFTVDARATTSDFFAMFDVPFLHGAPWTASDDESRMPVIVISRELNDRVFNGVNSVGNALTLNDRQYKVIGVLRDWRPLPRFYDVNGERYGKAEQAFLPFSQAVEQKLPIWGSTNCNGNLPNWDTLLQSDCVWVNFWVELPTAQDVAAYRRFLNSYAAEQQQIGRFNWEPRTQLRDVQQWLAYHQIVSNEVRIMVLVSMSFLAVCLMNAMGLMLAQVTARTSDIATRRTLGASRQEIFLQYLIEPGLLGILGGLTGVALTAIGILAVRTLFSAQVFAISHLDWTNIGIALLLALGGTLCAGIYPTLRATRVQPASALRVS